MINDNKKTAIITVNPELLKKQLELLSFIINDYDFRFTNKDEIESLEGLWEMGHSILDQIEDE